MLMTLTASFPKVTNTTTITPRMLRVQPGSAGREMLISTG